MKPENGRQIMLLLFVTINVFIAYSHAGITSSCHSPAVHEGDSVNITCQFNTNIESEKLAFQVDRYKTDTAHSVSEIILSCIWHSGKRQCTTKANYTFDDNVSDHIIITVPRATKDHAGRYVCQVVTSEDGENIPCVLYVLGKYSASEMVCAECVKVDNTPLHVTTAIIVLLIIVLLLLEVPRYFNTNLKILVRKVWQTHFQKNKRTPSQSDATTKGEVKILLPKHEQEQEMKVKSIENYKYHGKKRSPSLSEVITEGEVNSLVSENEQELEQRDIATALEKYTLRNSKQSMHLGRSSRHYENRQNILSRRRCVSESEGMFYERESQH